MAEQKNVSFLTTALTKVYLSGETEVHALRGVDVEILDSEIVVMLGPSGSGKSTFLNIIGGLDHPTSGHVFFHGQDLTKLSSRELTFYRRENIGFVFQAYNLVPSLTALENIALVTEISSNPMDPQSALSAVDLQQRANHFPSQLSGGEQQRVAIARALAKRPEVMLCDEPTGALDSETGNVVLRALMDINETYATTVIIITHNASIAQLAHRVIYFKDGHIHHIEKNKYRKTPEDIKW